MRGLIVHDFAYHYGGAERVTQALAEAFPEFDVLVFGGRRSVLERMGVESRTKSVLPLDRLEGVYRQLSPFLPFFAPRLKADVVVSSSYAIAHRVRARSAHVEYCHSPLRHIWVAEDQYFSRNSAVRRIFFRAIAAAWRGVDRRAARRVDHIVASCENVRDRVREAYGRDAEVVYPGVDLMSFHPSAIERRADTVLLVARLVEPYKRVSEAVRAFADLPFELRIAGTGRDEAVLKQGAPSNVTFLGWLDDDQLRAEYSSAQVLLFPSEDDFGIVPLEAMACGTPVVALDQGGARETVLAGVTGVRYLPGGMSDAVRTALTTEWDHGAIRSRALEFDLPRFIMRLRAIVEREIAAAAVA